MKNYLVTVPVLVSVSISVDAETEKEAIEKAVSEDMMDIGVKIDSNSGYELKEWNYYKSLSNGNYFLGHIGEIEVEEGF